ncbi:DUF5642 family protein [Mycobacterium angelicum]|uniref:DUF5642 domain-containing protein n=1 Tax=Mycobacterium angelicum TaxID=470074 RepID=A0A1X0A011_MYCAN|nr:DUF5642 family protein [Mycobacterium angelicum]MCV7196335.1 DUF5642 family protein [Mycobacterium angelicum]ORA23302.1 hypothetical protein BST12_07495 [Mycobacterium angelicum]
MSRSQAWIGALAALAVGGCAHSPAPAPSSVPSSPPAHRAAINPGNIKRVARELPPGYEVTNEIPSGLSPRVIWGVEVDAAAKPPECLTLADPGYGLDQSAQGLSGSGSGGIVDAVVVNVAVALDHSVVANCGQWTVSDRHTTARVGLVDAPHIDGAETVGMVADIRTAVESGSQIDSRTVTFIAYLGDYYVFTTLTTDPGSMLPPLPPQFAADLLVKTVSTLRS